MIALWRLLLAALTVVAAFLLVRPATEMLLAAIRSRMDKRFRWIVDVQRYMVAHIAWLVFFGVLWLVAAYILDLNSTNEAKTVLLYMTAVPVVLFTLALRKVVTKICIRNFKWDRDAADYAARIFIVTESIKFACFALVLVEIFFIFFVASDLAQFILVEVFFGLEIIALLAGFTTLKNVATGLFLIFAEPFRTGSLCKVRDLVGSIERVSLARTIMRRRDGCRVFIPNGIFAENAQTSGNALELRNYEVMLQLHRGTTTATIQQLIDELQQSLQEFAISPDSLFALPPFGEFSALSESLAFTTPAGTPQLSSVPSTSYSFSADPPTDERVVSVVLHAMYTIKVRILVDRDRFQTFEEAKTEVNMAIVGCLQRLHVVARQLVR